jgi:uncharacterized cofD-like protein
MNVLVAGNAELKKTVSEILARLNVHIFAEEDPVRFFAVLKSKKADLVIVDHDAFAETVKWRHFLKVLQETGARFIVLSSKKDRAAVLEARRFGSADYITKPYNHREFIMRFNAIGQKKTRIACIGGGTGLFTLLLGLKTLQDSLLTSIVNMSDDGGSSGKLSQTFGILPPGDIRRSLVALSNAPEVMNQIIQHRFEKRGELHGHSFGNIFLTVLAEVKGTMSEAVRALSDILNIQGIVLPATRTLTTLVAKFKDGTVVRGESRIDLCEGRKPETRIAKIWHDPVPECDIDAFASIVNADIVTIGPGDLFTSVITTLMVPGIREAVLASSAKKIYICNLMTKPGETAGYDAPAHVTEVRKALGRDCLSAVIVSNTHLSEESIFEYAKKHQAPVPPGTLARMRRATKARVVLADVGHETELVRHDSMKLKEEIHRLVKRDCR